MDLVSLWSLPQWFEFFYGISFDYVVQIFSLRCHHLSFFKKGTKWYFFITKIGGAFKSGFYCQNFVSPSYGMVFQLGSSFVWMNNSVTSKTVMRKYFSTIFISKLEVFKCCNCAFLFYSLFYLFVAIFLNFPCCFYAPYHMKISSPGPNLDLLCVWQSNAVPICENYVELYFDAKHLEKVLNRVWWNFWCPFYFKKVPFLANIGAALII